MGNDLLGGDHLEAGSVLAEVDPLHVHEPLAQDDHSGATRFGPVAGDNWSTSLLAR